MARHSAGALPPLYSAFQATLIWEAPSEGWSGLACSALTTAAFWALQATMEWEATDEDRGRLACSALTTAAFGALQATMEWEAQDEGFLAKILVADGAKDIAVGTPVAVVVDDADSVRDTLI